MLESIHIQHFKGFRDTVIGPFKKVNLIIGGQNVGKTSVLEAVQISMTGGMANDFRSNEGNDGSRLTRAVMGDPRLALFAKHGDVRLVLTRRSQDDPALTKLADVDRLALRSAISSGFGEACWLTNKAALRASIARCIAIPLFLPSQIHLVNLYGQVVLNKKRSQLFQLLKRVEPRLVSLDAISPDGEQRLYADLEGVGEALPLPQMGHGFSRLVYLFSELLVGDAKLALIDEVENGIHYTALPTLFNGMKVVAKEHDVQSLITTHSWDALRAACEVFEDAPDMFQVIRLERPGGPDADVKAVCIEGSRMLRLMAEEREVR